ncbi:hypothetical protein ONZ45_g2201 [Pleurotus djamor]|nr:hypothetical protein ONZ45_g2201 [Pleurotus djamor]
MSSFIPTVQLYQEPTDLKADWEQRSANAIIHSRLSLVDCLPPSACTQTYVDVPLKRLPPHLQPLYTQYVGLACFTALLWDHVITLADESPFSSLRSAILRLACSRLTYMVSIPVLRSHKSSKLTSYKRTSRLFGLPRCNRFIPFEGVATTFDVVAVNLMMLIRVRALYLKQKLVTGVLAAMILAELVLQVVLITTKAQAVKHTSAVHSCTMIFEPSASAAAAATAWIPLLYDTVVFGLTAHKVLHTSKSTARSGAILKQLFTGGLLYYSVMLIVTLVLTLMIPLAPPGLKNITAQ